MVAASSGGDQRVADHQLVEARGAVARRDRRRRRRAATPRCRCTGRARRPFPREEARAGEERRARAGLTERQQLGRRAETPRDGHRDELVVGSAEADPHPVACVDSQTIHRRLRDHHLVGSARAGEPAGHDDRVAGDGRLGCGVVERDGSDGERPQVRRVPARAEVERAVGEAGGPTDLRVGPDDVELVRHRVLEAGPRTGVGLERRDPAGRRRGRCRTAARRRRSARRRSTRTGWPTRPPPARRR